MPRYRYTAIDIERNKVTSDINADDEDDLRKILRSMNLIPLRYEKVDERSTSYRLKSNEVAEFCRQLNNMLASGITAVRAMEILIQNDFKPKLKAIYEFMQSELLKGVTLSEVMRMQGGTFPELLVNMFASAEASGQLEKTTYNMAIHYEKEHKLNGKIKSAMRYPQILIILTAIVVVAIFLFVLPTFFDTLREFGEMPLLTRVIISFTEFLQSYIIHLAAGVAAVFIGIKQALKVYKVRLWFDSFKLRMPAVGKPLRTIYTARFSRTLASLYSSGVSMIAALEITGTVLNNKYIESQFPQLVIKVRNGEPLSESLSKVDGFVKKLTGTMSIGEESGRLDAILESSAEMFDYEAEEATSALVAYAEPVMLIFIAAIVLIVILAVMTPMMSIYETLGV